MPFTQPEPPVENSNPEMALEAVAPHCREVIAPQEGEAVPRIATPAVRTETVRPQSAMPVREPSMDR